MPKTIPISSLTIPPHRQRQDFCPQALQELKTSIEDRGLMHPPVLRRVGDEWLLVAGERRLRAIKEIYELGGSFICDGQVFSATNPLLPFTNIGELDELAAEEAELDENLQRRDLTWQEHAAAVQRLHTLRGKQVRASWDLAVAAGNVSLPAQLTPPVHTVADTALELHGRSDGAYQAQTRKELIVAQHLDNPEVAKAKSADEAFKILKKQEEREKNIELARVVGATFTADKHNLLNENCLDYMQRVAEGSRSALFDVTLTDPPYGMGAESFGDAGGKLSGIEHHYDDSYESWLTLMTAWCPLSFAISKSQAHAYVFCDIDNFHTLRDLMRGAGWYVFRTPFIVHKVNSGRVPLPDRGPRRQYETLLYAIKGDKPVTHIYGDVIPCQADENLSHGAQKPVALFQNLLQRSVKAGDRVFDGFAGTGTVFQAAHNLKCEAVGCELTPEYYAIALKRLQGMKELESNIIAA